MSGCGTPDPVAVPARAARGDVSPAMPDNLAATVHKVVARIRRVGGCRMPHEQPSVRHGNRAAGYHRWVDVRKEF